MWKNFKSLSKNLLQCENYFVEQQRTTFILKRKHEVWLNKLSDYFPKKLRRREYYYELIEDRNSKKKPPLNLVLIKDVPGVGMIGDKIQTKYYTGYVNFLLPKLAVYENSPEAKNIVRKDTEKRLSSIYCRSVENFFIEQPLAVFLSTVNQWTLQPWHIRVALRRIGIITQDNCIKLPSKIISGPNPELENKDFLVQVVMNKSEVFPVRCRIFHCNAADSQIYKSRDEIVKLITSECDPLFDEDREKINELLKTREELIKRKEVLKSLKIL